MSSADTWLLIGVCLLIASVIAILVIKRSARCAIARKRWQQRRAIRRLKRQLPKQLQQEKQQLCDLWNGNPAAECVTIFNRFKHREEKLSLQELADDTDHAIKDAFSLFGEDFLRRYEELYANRLVVQTTEIAKQIAGQYPEHASLILQRLTEKDTEISRCRDEAIRDALSQGEEDQELIRAQLNQLMEDSAHFRRVIIPGIVQRHTGDLVGVAVDAVLEHFGTSWLTGMRGGLLARRMWKGWRSKADQEFGDSFVTILTEQLPALCERMDSRVRQSLSGALDPYIEHKLKHEQATLDVLLNLSRAKCDVESGICWFRNAFAIDASSTLVSWSRLFAGAGVLAFVAAASAVWLYSPRATKPPATMPLLENKEATAVAAHSQLDTSVALPVIATGTSANQPMPTAIGAITPATSNAGGIPHPTEARVGQKKAAIEQREPQAVHSDSPAEGKYPFARRAERPGFYYSPYTGRVYDLRRVAAGGLVRDPDTDKFFRRPYSDGH
jgi:hypothetical protein